ncbi:MAG TPA: T9SS type A sorting domain-containing protein [Chitinophagales bacterium]|nr:T9SS type A sorting domain-containing protein [Chitinophagales bacterium]
MRKVSTLFMLLLITGVAAFGQAAFTKGPQKALRDPNSPRPVHHGLSESRGGLVCDELLLLDYNLHNEVEAANATPPLTFNGSWYTGTAINIQEITPFADANHFTDYTFAATRFDSLVFADLGTGTVVGVPRADKTISLDSLGMFVAIWGDTVAANGKMTNDSLLFRIYSITGTTVSAQPVKTVVFSGYNGLSQFFNGQGFIGYSQIGINQQFTLGQGFAVRMDYRGKDTSSHCFLSYTYADSCGTITFQGSQFDSPAYPSPFAGSSSWGSIGQTGTVTPQNSGFAYNLPGVPENCSYLYTQNWEFLPIITICSTGVSTPLATVITTPATNVVSTTATLNGSVNANGNSTVVTFEYGTTTAYGQTATATPSPVTGSSATTVSANISGLTANTLYHFRVKGVNGGGTANGSDLTFTTLAAGTVCTPDPNTPTFGPTSDNVPCIQQGVSFSQTYTFVVPALATSVRIDSVVNLPAGLTAQASKNPPLYTSNERGCLLVTGTTNAACGQYQMLIYVTIVSGLGTQQGELSALGGAFGFTKVWLRVIGNGGTCPAVDANQTAIFAAGSCGLVSITATANATSVNCFGGATGTATVTANGGSNYSYLWSNGQTSATATGLIAGTYTVTVTSGNATATATATVTQPASALTVTATTTPNTGGNNGGVNTTATGGTGTYLYVWSNGATSADLTNVAPGAYTVTVTDQNGCTASGTYTVADLVGINNIELVNKFSVFPNPASTMVNVQVSFTETTDTKIELMDLTGKVVLTENTGKTNQLNRVLNVSSIPAGVYAIRVSGAKFNVVKQLTISK